MIWQISKSVTHLLIIVLLGTFGYHFIEGWSLFESLYMTIISLTTVGYGEIHSLSNTGKIFTMILIITGISNFAIVIRNLSLQVLKPLFGNSYREKKMEKMLQNMQDHFIICGFGRIGRDVCLNLINSDIKIVIIDNDPEKSPNEYNIPIIHGDASSEEVLTKAGIGKAKGLVSTVDSDAGNVFITLTARELNPSLFIIARYEIESTKGKLKRAGADHVINPYQIGSDKISQIIIKPTISKILDFAHQKGHFELSIEELEISGNHPLIGQKIRDCGIRDQFNVIIIAVEKTNGEIVTNPGPNYQFKKYDRVVLIANQNEVFGLFQYYQK